MFNTLKNKLNPATNAVDLLKADHREVEAVFKAFDDTKDGRSKRSIVMKICAALEAHAAIEETIFYPAVKREVADIKDLINEGIVEHAGAKNLIAELKTMSTSEEFHDPKVTVLMEYIKHHVKEEESSMFPKVEDSDMDLIDLAERMQIAKQQILKAA